ncbi:hypothetical protein DFA_05448 [Cavenderia fasciculata]|uniref:Uncharacterized protein n=1 Tax=Cavenderia fasciculata TaxID=261658 RepID=F4PL94_CACFS|nr:uncharacterized protein DFA_05448 [Cavenderia fasciculata]EGG23316.1 hypothetical protein DFA_05448 [Cavenderia fasciculata]|eukprot:XP_004361167.1 hypothetical protein DFA_05448 [Cavenderia fasciculata]
MNLSHLVKITPVARTSLASRALDFINPITGDITAKFINIAGIFVTGYGLNCLINEHHDHQDVVYPYMKTKSKTLAHLKN